MVAWLVKKLASWLGGARPGSRDRVVVIGIVIIVVIVIVIDL
jgi:hypothetical protein